MAPTDREALWAAARQLTPAGATLTHLCSTELSTFQVETQGGDVYAVKLVESVSSEFERSDQEWAALMSLDHPHVVPYRDAGSITIADGRSYRWLLMPYVEGVSLDAYLRRSPSHDLAVMVRLLRDAVAGATAFWSLGTAHGDLIPENMVVTPAGRLVVVDLGMRLRHLAPVADASTPGLARLAPEQLAGKAPTPRDWQSDQYDLGLVGYRLVTGAPFFGAAHRNPEGEAAAASPLSNFDVPLPLARVVTTMLAHDPQDRWPDGDLLLTRVEEVAASLPPGRVVTAHHVPDDPQPAASCAVGPARNL